MVDIYICRITIGRYIRLQKYYWSIYMSAGELLVQTIDYYFWNNIILNLKIESSLLMLTKQLNSNKTNKLQSIRDLSEQIKWRQPTEHLPASIKTYISSLPLSCNTISTVGMTCTSLYHIYCYNKRLFHASNFNNVIIPIEQWSSINFFK